MYSWWWLAALAASACVRTDTSSCGDEICPAGTICIAATVGVLQTQCVRPGQVEACASIDDGNACTLPGTTSATATCLGGACFPDACGDGLRGALEACDDANVTSGDGCSSDCRSMEVCGNGVVDPTRLVGGVPEVSELCDDGNAWSHDGCSACEPEVATWSEIRTELGPRTGHAMAFDTRRRELLMFGGSDATGQTPTDLWEWSHDGWHRKTLDIEPFGRVAHGLAYDQARDRLVMFGGADTSFSVPTGDLWEWDGVRWDERVAPNGPGPRFMHAMVYNGKRTLVVGGQSPSFAYLADTWAWDGTSWSLLIAGTSPDALPGRARAAIAYDPARGEVVLFGGADGGLAPRSDTFVFDGARWRRAMPTVNPPGRTDAAMAWDPASQRIILSGGLGANGTTLSDSWAWDGTSWTTLPAGPPARFGAALASDLERGGVVLFGGALSALASRSDTWWFDGAAWHDDTPSASPAGDIGATYVDDLDMLVAFGGGAGPITATTHVLDRGAWHLVPASAPTPSARLAPNLVYMPPLQSVVMWGGSGGGGVVTDGTWAFANDRWRRLAEPGATVTPRLLEAYAFDAARGTIVLFGGAKNTVPSAETWVFDGVAWTQLTPVSSPPARVNASMAYDPIRQRVLLYGGQAYESPFSDLWEWDGIAWTEIPQTTRPPARANALLSWNARRGRLLLSGGNDVNGVLVRDVWELDGTTWHRVNVVATPPAAFGIGMIATRFGALRTSVDESNGKKNALWRLRWESPIPEEVCSNTLDFDGDGARGCADPDCELECTACGDSVCSPLENCRLCPTDCGACEDRCGDGACSQGESVVTCPGDC